MTGERKPDDPQACGRFAAGCFWRGTQAVNNAHVRESLKLARIRAELEVLAVSRITGTLEFRLDKAKLESEFREIFTGKGGQADGNPLEKLVSFWPTFEAWLRSGDCAIRAYFKAGIITRIETK